MPRPDARLTGSLWHGGRNGTSETTGGGEVDQIIIHVDMDAFYASVEIRDNPALYGRPLIIGSLPTERGVVATCSYKTRRNLFPVRVITGIQAGGMLCG